MGISSLSAIGKRLAARLLQGKPVETPEPEAPPPERPRRQRVVRYFECTWVSDWGPVHARINNLSPTGCYVESRFAVPAVGQAVDHLTVTPAAGPPFVLRGSVIESTKGIGFAVRFSDLDTADRDHLEALLRSLPPSAS